MEHERQVTLSLVKYIGDQLVASGWNNVTFVTKYPDNLNKIVVSGTGASDEVILPAITMLTLGTTEGPRAGIGDILHEQMAHHSIFLYATTEGQEKDLRQFMANRLYHSDASVYYFPSGYPYSGTLTPKCDMVIDGVVHRPVYSPQNENVALRYGGLINFTVLTYF